ncbi:chlorophyll synthesis pathway protein BchC [Paracoccaceae bacterium Fryx2]|nr:chlorophyll synthesis pathway protein BchC [Paracoccaceae bacterium Fryx2]
METNAVILSGPKQLGIESLSLIAPGAGDLVVEISHSGISTGTEKLFWSGTMPPFPGMGYPLVPGYEAAGEVVEAGADSGFKVGERVFVPGANCFLPRDGEPVRGLFGGASHHLVTAATRVTRIDPGWGAEGALLALAATARHALAGFNYALPDLIVGHGVLGRLLARLTVAAGAAAPTVWEVNPARAQGAIGYEVTTPEADPRRDYRSIYDASGDAKLLDTLIGRIAKGGEVVLAGFYTVPIQFTFAPAFMREARLRIAAEWDPEDMEATRSLIESGALSMEGLVTHRRPASAAKEAYETAFTDPDCLKMILSWKAQA